MFLSKSIPSRDLEFDVLVNKKKEEGGGNSWRGERKHRRETEASTKGDIPSTFFKLLRSEYDRIPTVRLTFKGHEKVYQLS